MVYELPEEYGPDEDDDRDGSYLDEDEDDLDEDDEEYLDEDDENS